MSFTNFDEFHDWFKSLSSKGKSKFCKDNKIQVEFNNPKKSGLSWKTLGRKEWLEEIKIQYEFYDNYDFKFPLSNYKHL